MTNAHPAESANLMIRFTSGIRNTQSEPFAGNAAKAVPSTMMARPAIHSLTIGGKA